MTGLDSPSDILPSEPLTLYMRAMHRLAWHMPAPRQKMTNQTPLLSITFDDVPESAVQQGGGILEEAGARGTFFIATSLFGRRTPYWQVANAEAVASLTARGHEIGLHSHSHKPVAPMAMRDFIADLDRSQAALATLVPTARIENYAYPFGLSSMAQKHYLGRRVRSSRTTHPGINDGAIDPHFLLSISLGQTATDRPAIDHLIARAARRNGWLILTVHDVADKPSPYGCTPALLAYAIQRAAAQGFGVCTIADALDRAGIAKL
ncbi:polysaccharide deacetylase family protein [Lichenihabitans psoromatis]|uniref:polysaccharide deacetylase family protein n=1 Tax=Lichenihabitans psoromatis TaxID=2528642 RepID=UPI0010383EBC|nr:polysaccharide deacetylase family protein [Lichenihabitans psoromatis]